MSGVVDRLIELQAAANANQWTVRSLEVPLRDAKAIAAELMPGHEVRDLGEVGTVDGITLIAVADWEPEAT